MEAETEFAVLYKKLIDGHFAPEQQRAEAALFAVLSRLSDPVSEKPAVSEPAREVGRPQEYKHANEAALP